MWFAESELCSKTKELLGVLGALVVDNPIGHGYGDGNAGLIPVEDPPDAAHFAEDRALALRRTTCLRGRLPDPTGEA